MLVSEWDGVGSVEVLGFGCEEWGARKAVEVLPESEVDETRGKVGVEDETVGPVAVPYPPSLILEDLEFVFVMGGASTRVSVSLSSRSLSLSRFELDLDVWATSG